MADNAKTPADMLKPNKNDAASVNPANEAMAVKAASPRHDNPLPGSVTSTTHVQGARPAGGSAPPPTAQLSTTDPVPPAKTPLESPATPSPGNAKSPAGGKPVTPTAPTPVATPADRHGAAPAVSAKNSAPASPGANRPAVAHESGMQSASAATASATSTASLPGQPDAKAAPYRPSEPKSDWRAGQDGTGPSKPSTLRPLLVGAAGGALAALLVVGLWRPGVSADSAPALQNNGKVATALEEIEKDRSAFSERNSAVERSAADLAARLATLEQKADANASSGGAASPEAVVGRIKALEQKLAATADRDSAAVNNINQRLAGLEQRINANSGSRTQGQGGNSPAASSGARDYPMPGIAGRQAPLATYEAEGAQQDFRPPGFIPEQERPQPKAPVRGWVLHSVYGGVAVLESRTAGIVEVRRGQSVQGLGRITSIERRGNRWVVTTDRGVIATPFD